MNFRSFLTDKAKSTQLLFYGCLVCLSLVMSACESYNPNPPLSDSEATTNTTSDTNLVLENATLEQSSDRDNTIWKIESERTIYSEDKQTALLERVTGNLWQDGQIILKASAQTGEIKNDSGTIFLRDNIIVSDPRNGTIIKAEELEWQTQDGVVLIRHQLRGDDRAGISVTADEGRYFTATEKLELRGNIVANTTDPSLQLTTEQLDWYLPQQQAVSNLPLEIIRYQNEVVTERVFADRGEVNLAQNLVTLEQNVEFQALEPQLQIATNFITWNYQNRSLDTNTPIQIVDPQNQLTVTGNRGQVKLAEKVAYLRDGTQAINQGDRATLYADELIWQMSNQTVEAIGNVSYQQSEPQLHLRGDRAEGNLVNKNVVVKSKSNTRVVTEIQP